MTVGPRTSRLNGSYSNNIHLGLLRSDVERDFATSPEIAIQMMAIYQCWSISLRPVVSIPDARFWKLSALCSSIVLSDDEISAGIIFTLQMSQIIYPLARDSCRSVYEKLAAALGPQRGLLQRGAGRERKFGKSNLGHRYLSASCMNESNESATI